MPTIADLLDAHRAAIIASRTSVAVDAMAAGDLTCLRAVRAARDALVAAGVSARLADAHGQAVADWLDGRRDAVAVIAAGERNISLARPALLLATRLPISDPNDMAFDRQVITDPISGLSFEIAGYPGYRMATYEVAIAWGTKVLRPEFISVLRGAA